LIISQLQSWVNSSSEISAIIYSSQRGGKFQISLETYRDSDKSGDANEV
jgi:hypothetical protein